MNLGFRNEPFAGGRCGAEPRLGSGARDDVRSRGGRSFALRARGARHRGLPHVHVRDAGRGRRDRRRLAD